jgi:hypothetical protein
MLYYWYIIERRQKTVKKDVTVTVVYPVTFNVKIDTLDSLETTRRVVKDIADTYKFHDDPVIHACDDFPELVE